MPIAVIAFDFDPLLHLAEGLTVRWQTIALAAVIALCLSTAGILARRSGLRADDLLYVAIGAVPGAVLGGRIGYALLVPDAFRSGPMTLLDPAIGVAGGLVTGSVVAALLGAPVGRWAHALAVPLLVGIAAGKLTMALGGSGQGRAFDGTWATAYVGAGPWVGLAPDLPSHPAQVYEAVGTLAVALIVVLATAVGAFRGRDGSRLLVAIAGWAAVRAVVSTTWRDPVVAGSLPVGGIVALVVGLGAILAAVLVSVWRPRRAGERTSATAPAWPEPETRPPF